MRCGLGVGIGAFPYALLRVQLPTEPDGLARPARVELVGGLRIEPVASAARADTLWGNDAHVLGQERPAAHAGIELGDVVVAKLCQALGAGLIGFARGLEPGCLLCVFGDELHFHRGHRTAELLMETLTQDAAERGQVKAMRGCLVRYLDRDAILASCMLDAAGIAEERPD